MKKWYLMKPPYDQLSGYEEEAIDDFGQTGFDDVLDSAMAVDVELYNYDLSVCNEIKVVIQNVHQD